MPKLSVPSLIVFVGAGIALYGFVANKNWAKVGGITLVVIGGVVYAVSETKILGHFGENAHIEGVIA